MTISLVLHIGDPKTGSSSIQEVLRHGLWDCPTVTLAYPEQLNSFPLANAVSDPKQADQRADRWGKLADWLRAGQADVAVVSAEQFFRVDPKALLDTLNEFLPEYVADLRIIAYVRPHASRLVSAYMQRSKAGLFQGDMQTFFDRTQAEHLLHFAPRFERWRATFGAAFTLRPMIRAQLRDGDVVADFMDFALNGAPFSLRAGVEVNASLPLEHLVGLREVQAVLKRNKIAAGTRHSVGDHISRSLARMQPGAGTKLQFSQALYQDIRAYALDDAKALDREFFDGQPLMAQALEAAAGDAAPTAQVDAASVHYRDEVIRSLRQKGRQLVALFKKRPSAWTIVFERDIGQRPSDDGKALPPQIRTHVEKVNAVLTETARLICDLGEDKPL